MVPHHRVRDQGQQSNITYKRDVVTQQQTIPQEPAGSSQDNGCDAVYIDVPASDLPKKELVGG